MANWFVRLTDGFRTWAPIDPGLGITSDLDAEWNIANSAQAELTATYSVSSDVVTYDTGWFPRLSNGYATWAGSEIVDPGTGFIDGGGEFPVWVESSLSAEWQVVQPIARDLAATYQLRNAISQDLSAEYTVTGSAAANLAATYTVLGPVSRDLAATYQLRNAVEQDRAAAWDILSEVYQDVSAEYDLETTPLSAAQNLTATYNVVQGVERDLIGAYDILAAISPAELTAEWHVLSPVAADMEVFYQVISQPEADLIAAYSIDGAIARASLSLRPIVSRLELRPRKTTIELNA